MHAGLRSLVATVITAAAVVGPLIVPAAADLGGPSFTPPTATDDGFFTQLRADINLINGGGTPVPCSEEDFGYNDDNDTVDYPGHVVYGPLRHTTQDQWSFQGDPTQGYHVRQDCLFLGERPPDLGVDIYLEIMYFPNITAENLARLAVAEHLQRVPAPQVHFNPGETLVALETWLWVDGIAQGEFVSPPVSVPGITVVVTARTGGVWWDLGEGEIFCASAGVPYPASATDCSYAYQRAGVYNGSATISWRASYTVNGGAAFQVDEAVVRQTSFVLPVMEAQAINTAR